MKKFIKVSFSTIGLISLLSLAAFAQKVSHAPFDVTNYQMDVQLVPSEQKIVASVDVSFTPLADSRSFDFELNGSLKVDSVTRVGGISQAVTTAPTTPQKGVKPAPKPTLRFSLSGDLYPGPARRQRSRPERSCRYGRHRRKGDARDAPVQIQRYSQYCRRAARCCRSGLLISAIRAAI